MAASSFALGCIHYNFEKYSCTDDKEILHTMKTIQAEVHNHTDRGTKYLQEALDKQPSVIFEGRVGSTEAGALPLGGGEEEAEGPHDLTRKSSQLPTVSTYMQNFQKVRKQRNCHPLFLTEIFTPSETEVNKCLFPGKAWRD